MERARERPPQESPPPKSLRTGTPKALAKALLRPLAPPDPKLRKQSGGRSKTAGSLAVILVLALGCVSLTPDGRMVRELSLRPPTTDCQFLGIVERNDGLTWRDTMNALRNNVAEIGGDTYVLVSVDDASGYAQAEAYQCRVLLDEDLIPPDTLGHAE